MSGCPDLNRGPLEPHSSATYFSTLCAGVPTLDFARYIRLFRPFTPPRTCGCILPVLARLAHYRHTRCPRYGRASSSVVVVVVASLAVSEAVSVAVYILTHTDVRLRLIARSSAVFRLHTCPPCAIIDPTQTRRCPA